MLPESFVTLIQRLPVASSKCINSDQLTGSFFVSDHNIEIVVVS